MSDLSSTGYSSQSDSSPSGSASLAKKKRKKKAAPTTTSSLSVSIPIDTTSTLKTMPPTIDPLPSTPPSPSSTSSSSPSPSSLLCSFRRTPLTNALHLSLSFCLIFLAFSVAQNSQTSLDPKVGAIGLGILYAVFTLSNTFSAWVVNSTSTRLSLFFGALTYALYVAANIHTLPLLLYPSSAIIGLGAAILWTAQGSFIAHSSAQHERAHSLPPHSTMGYFNGIFFSIFQVNQFLGNLLAALLYTYQATQAAVFGVMTVICGCGVATLLLLPKTSGAPSAEQRALRTSSPPSEADEEEGGSGAVASSAASSTPPDYSIGAVLASLTLLKDLRLLLLLPLIIYSGFSQSWIFGAFPPLILGNQHRFFVLAFLGAMDALSSYIMGKVSDVVGRLPILLLGFVAHTAVFGYIVLGYAPAIVTGPNPDTTGGSGEVSYMQLDLVWFFVLALLLGVGDGVFNTQVYAILGTFFKLKAEAAFANFKLFQSLSTAVFYFYLYFTDVQALKSRTVIPLACMAIGMVLVVYCNVVFPFEAKRGSGEGGGVEVMVEDGVGNGVEEDGEEDEEEVAPVPVKGKAARRQR